MNNYYYQPLLASVYGEDSYGTSAYNGSETEGTNTGTTTGSTTPEGTNNGLLTNTGFEIAVAVTVAAVIMFSAVIVKIARRPHKTSQ